MAIIQIPDIQVDDQNRKTMRHVHGGFVADIEYTKCGRAHVPGMLPASQESPWCEECIALDG